MPTYDYVCKNCEAKSESFQKITDEALTNCEHCGKNSLQRGFGGGSGLVFKGAGFYITDYAKLQLQPTTHDGSFSCCPCGKTKCDA